MEDWEEHIGLKNINRRIQLHFGERYGVRICRENGNTKIALHFAAIEERNRKCVYLKGKK